MHLVVYIAIFAQTPCSIWSEIALLAPLFEWQAWADEWEAWADECEAPLFEWWQAWADEWPLQWLHVSLRDLWLKLGRQKNGVLLGGAPEYCVRGMVELLWWLHEWLASWAQSSWVRAVIVSAIVVIVSAIVSVQQMQWSWHCRSLQQITCSWNWRWQQMMRDGCRSVVFVL